MEISSIEKRYYKGWWLNVETFKIINFLKDLFNSNEFSYQPDIKIEEYHIKNIHDQINDVTPIFNKESFIYKLISLKFKHNSQSLEFSLNALEINNFSYFFLAIPKEFNLSNLLMLGFNYPSFIISKIPVISSKFKSEMSIYKAKHYYYNPFAFTKFKIDFDDIIPFLYVFQKLLKYIDENWLKEYHLEYRAISIKGEWDFFQIIIKSIAYSYYTPELFGEIEKGFKAFLNLLETLEMHLDDWPKICIIILEDYLSSYIENFGGLRQFLDEIIDFFKINFFDKELPKFLEYSSLLGKKVESLSIKVSERTKIPTNKVNVLYKKDITDQIIVLRRLLNVDPLPKERTSDFSKISHEELCQAVHRWIQNIFPNAYSLITHNIREEGIDILISFMRDDNTLFFKIGLQLKSYKDIQDANFSTKTDAQIEQSRSHKVEKLIIAFAGDMMDQSQIVKVRGKFTDISKRDSDYIICIDPERLARIVLNK